MKKKFVILSVLLIVVLTLGACANTDENNQSRQDQNQNKMETKASSIFQQADVKNMKVTTNKAEVKSGPSEKFKTIATLNKNETAKVLAQIKDWYVIQLENNRIGSVNSNQTKPIVEEGQPRPPQPQPTPQPEQTKTPEPKNPQENQSAEEIEPVNDLSSMERQMVDLINEARKNNDVTPLKTDNELTRVARMKSQDMVKNDYFSHYSPTYGSPFDMLNKFGVEYIQAGENIAGNSSVEAAHRGLMNSTGHRRNILNPQYTHVGVGAKSSDKYGYIFTQLFISKPK
ncbi:CAP domain-containing protein [Acetohalobium arabaticum]|uniref:SCP-like extracellular n=1 Tax=Acetohalobium arabaticum (strain ATCC 49924 / DSM 5501 / Z-7288) TaxID=574087 RepID=D9QQF4_ACEAZ|nr:CAP domain-containing protein [Acetohalobium arabaticum]ADL12745.1 SCP-like extracellular [Acetohalobium arabaticum DSM 5501]